MKTFNEYEIFKKFRDKQQKFADSEGYDPDYINFKEYVLVEDLLPILSMIRNNDKTRYRYNGEHSRNRDGLECPESKGGRWATPFEIANELLEELKK